MKEECPYRIVECTKGALGLAVLCWGVWAWKTQQNAMGHQEGGVGIVNELRAIVNLETLHRKTELGACIGHKLNYVLVDLRLASERKGPAKVWVVVQNQKIVGETRDAIDRWGPNITVK
jgi:hypothetical protein